MLWERPGLLSMSEFKNEKETLPCLRQTGEGILLEFVRRPPSRGGVRNDDAVWRVWRAEGCALCVWRVLLIPWSRASRPI